MNSVLRWRSRRRILLTATVMVVFSVIFAGSGTAAQKIPANPVVEMVIEKRGKIQVELLPKAAPKTVAHFVALVNRNFYDGVLFHRVEPGFVAQTGDPESKKVDGQKIARITPAEVTRQFRLGLGGSGKTVPLEATLPHLRGTLGLARGMEHDSGDSQFFFNLSDNHTLDYQYCLFGKIVSGAQILDSIRQGDRIKSIRVVRKSHKPR